MKAYLRTSEWLSFNFMCLCESSVKSSVSSLIQNNIDSHEISNANSYIVFNKSGWPEDGEHSTGGPYGGVAIIYKGIDGLSCEMINSRNSRIIVVLLKDYDTHICYMYLCNAGYYL